LAASYLNPSVESHVETDEVLGNEKRPELNLLAFAGGAIKPLFVMGSEVDSA
jgi:hypothetical protein